jgi:hypothetical protein
MKFILTFTLPPATRDAAMARFLETGGQPPPGVRLLGRWTRLDLCGGFVLLESEDPQALTAFAHGWSDVAELTIAPVLEDQALSDVLKRARVQPGRASSSGEGLPQAATIVADQDLPDATPPEADQTGEVIPVPPPPAVPGGLEGEGEEPGQAGEGSSFRRSSNSCGALTKPEPR